jgi:Domain of unknown function (DUF4129)
VRLPPSLILASWLGAVAWAPACAAQDADEPLAAMPSAPEVRAALEEVAADPNLASERTIHTLRWTASDEPQNRSSLGWLVDLARLVGGVFRWLAESGRALLWVLGAILAALLVVFLIRVARAWRRVPALPKRFVAPSHVRDLDIRPESLPEDVGAAAAALWDAGDERAALALLYRGAVSRLVHAHRVPIRDSSTEGDCLTLAEPLLDGAAAGYFAGLVTTWRNAVYGGLSPATSTVHELCARFAEALGREDAVPAQSSAAT